MIKKGLQKQAKIIEKSLFYEHKSIDRQTTALIFYPIFNNKQQVTFGNSFKKYKKATFLKITFLFKK